MPSTRMGIAAGLVLACFSTSSVEAKDEDPLCALFASLTAGGAYAAVEEAHGKGDRAAAPALFDAALRARHPHLAVAVGDALRDLGAEWAATSEFAAALKAALRAKKEETRLNLARVLGAWGLPSFDESLAELATKKRSPRVQEEALYMAGALPVTDAETFPETAKAVEAALKSRAAEVRIAACAAAGRRRMKALAPRLAEMARKDRERWVGEYAVRALERIDEPIDLAEFASVLRRKPKPAIRAAALKAVATFPRAADLPTLVRLLRHKDGDVRWAALTGVQLAVAPELFGANPESRGSIATADAEVVGKLARTLADVAFQDEGGWRRHAAVHALGRMREAVGPDVRERAVKKLGDAKAEQVILAIKLCARLGVAEAYPQVLAIAGEADDLAVRTTAARALEMLDAPAACRDLLEGLEPYKRSNAGARRSIDALGYVRCADGVHGLVALLGEEGWGEEGLRALETALERLTGRRFGSDAAVWKTWLAKARAPFPAPMAVSSPRDRRAAVAKDGLYGFRPEFDAAMEGGLAWLDRRQHGCGCWAGAEDGLGERVDQHAVYTALALLAFTGAGYRPDGGRYRETVWRASEFTAATQRFDGRVAGRVLGRGSWHSELEAWGPFVVPLGTWGLVDAWATGRDAARRSSAQRALDYASHIALPGLGWGRLEIDEESFAPSVLGLVTTGFGAAAGLDVDPWARDGADLRMRLSTTDMWGVREELSDLVDEFDHTVGKDDAFFAYAKQPLMSASELRNRGRLPAATVNEVALVGRLFSGWERSHPALRGWARYLSEAPPTWEGGPPGPDIGYPHVYWWLSSWAMFQMGGKSWKGWSDRLGRMLCDRQSLGDAEVYGSWTPDRKRTPRGRLFATAMALFALQSWYRFPPRLVRP